MIYKKVRLIEDQISALAIGCWNFGGDWDCSNDDNTREIVHAAIANGINFFDVAPVYGWYHSEEVLGKILEEGGYLIDVADAFIEQDVDEKVFIISH